MSGSRNGLAAVNEAVVLLSDSGDVVGSDSIAITATDSDSAAAASESSETGNDLPVIAAPGEVMVSTGQTTPIAGVSLIGNGDIDDEVFTVTVSDTNGVLSATGSGVSGSGTTSLTTTGSLDQVNTALATLTDTTGEGTAPTATPQAMAAPVSAAPVASGAGPLVSGGGGSGVITDIVSFNGADGSRPFDGGLIADAAGDLFGVTGAGGGSGDGTVFEIVNTSNGYSATPTMLISFNGTGASGNGSSPTGTLVADAAGDLFGVTGGGGTNGDGTVYELVNGGNGNYTFKTLVNFNGANGSGPSGGLILDAAGDLLGTTSSDSGQGYGTVFEITLTSGVYSSTPKVLAVFNGYDGANPEGGLIADSAGNLIGVSAGGGASFNGDTGDGAVFEIAKTGSNSYASTPSDIVSFNITNGAAPYTGLIADAAGDLFGTTYDNDGGNLNNGTVFELIYHSSYYQLVTLVSFNGTDGQGPRGALTMDAGGDLFGTTVLGGADGDGEVFEITGSGTSYSTTPTILASFNSTNGADSYSSLLLTSAGQLLGTTYVGGANNDGTVFSVAACYLRRTSIATPGGDIAIEDLRIGDAVTLADGFARTIKWIGRRSYDGAARAVQPVCLRAGSLERGVPTRDLFVSPLHAMLIDGVLVPASALVNGRSIVQCGGFARLDYIHLEFDAHVAILAEGAPSESFVDCDNRWMFQNGDEYAALYPGEIAQPWQFCAPRHEAGEEVDAIRDRLSRRAEAFDDLTLTDHGLFLRADGRAVLPEIGPEGRLHFHLPSCPEDLRLVSRHGVPAELGLSGDVRRLGVAVGGITLRAENSCIALGPDDLLLREGFHATEGTHRWTDGEAVLKLCLLNGLAGALSLEIDVTGLPRYPAGSAVQGAAAKG